MELGLKPTTSKTQNYSIIITNSYTHLKSAILKIIHSLFDLNSIHKIKIHIVFQKTIINTRSRIMPYNLNASSEKQSLLQLPRKK